MKEKMKLKPIFAIMAILVTSPAIAAEPCQDNLSVSH
jgi:hypothetical protein